MNLKIVVSDQLVAKDQNGTHLYDESSMISYQILREFIRSEFLKPVGKGTEYLHRISGAICRVWFGSGEFDGWLYPSVHTPAKNNIALKPESAHRKLEIEQVHIIKFIKKTDAMTNYETSSKMISFLDNTWGVFEAKHQGHIKNKEITWVPNNGIHGIF